MIFLTTQSARIQACLYLILYVFVLLLGGCTIPRIIVLEDPLTPEEHINLGLAYEKEGMVEAAFKEYQKAAKAVPLADYYIGNLYFQTQELELAEEHYKKAIARDKGNADARNNLAWLYYVKNEKLEAAENLALQALELNPSKRALYEDTLEKIRSLRKGIQ